jgi:hypothetical protein
MQQGPAKTGPFEPADLTQDYPPRYTPVIEVLNRGGLRFRRQGLKA